MKKSNQFEIDVKRLAVPDIEASCPKCKTTCRHDYLSYPTANKAEDLCFYCPQCEHEFDRAVTLHVRLEIAKTPLAKVKGSK